MTLKYSYHIFFVLAILINSSILFETSKGTISLILSSSQSHHFISNKSFICSSENLYLIILAGFPPTKAYGGSYAYGGAYSAGGQYQEGGTYYLSDEEIQALVNAGYELE